MRNAASSQRERSYAQAIQEGLAQAMANDGRVILIGEGVPDPKSIFGTTAGLREQFGRDRVFDMPLSENGMTGICIGAALSGMRPVLVHQRIDFALLSMDQLVNNAAKWHYMFNGQAAVPLVVRMIVGRGWGQGPQHSQSLQAMFAHVAGLKVIMPATPNDAKGMLLSAIADNNPVLFIEHRWLHPIKGNVPEHDNRTDLGSGRVVHRGEAVTVAAFSYMVIEACMAAQALKEEMGVDIEVLDMRSVRPLDIDLVLQSLSKTRHLIVADTAPYTGSIAGELIAQVLERGFDLLRIAPARIASPDYPTPTSPFMTDGYYPDAQAIADAVIDQLAGNRSSAGYARLRNRLAKTTPHDQPNTVLSGYF